MVNAIIKNYDDMLYESGPVKYNDFISDKYNKLHKQLYNNAINKLVKDLVDNAIWWNNLSDDEKNKEENNNKKPKFTYVTIRDFYENTKIIELKNTEYWKSSHVYIIDYNNKHIRYKYDLSTYWNNSLRKPLKHIEDLKLTDEPIKDAKILYLNYVNGIANVESKMFDIDFDIDFDYLSEDTEIDDEYLLNNTFTYKYNNIK